MKIKLYQVNMERDTNRVAFTGYENLEKFQGSPEIDSKIPCFSGMSGKN